MTLRDKQRNSNYPVKTQQFTYGIRYWNGERWLYWSATPSNEWFESDRDARVFTDLLDTMFNAQVLSQKLKAVVEVVLFEEPKTLRSVWYKNLALRLESIEDNRNRINNLMIDEDGAKSDGCKCDSLKNECCDICTGWDGSNKLDKN